MDSLAAIQLLTEGTIEPQGQVAWGSNYTMLATICAEIAGEAVEQMMIYKPRKGERPLWDFDTGTLCQRERAAWIISEAMAWHLVPPTIMREGPYGIGSVQLFIDHDPNVTYFDIQDDPIYQTQLQQIVLFDFVTNNADRKGGHVLLGQDDRLWGIDHGLCFHEQYKLRTVIWEFAGTPIPDVLLSGLHQLNQWINNDNEGSADLAALITSAELTALSKRLNGLIELREFPQPGAGHRYPWPPV